MEKIMFKWWNFQRYLKSEKGQGMVEYALILGLIALASILTMTSVGTEISTKFTNIATNIRNAGVTPTP